MRGHGRAAISPRKIECRCLSCEWSYHITAVGPVHATHSLSRSLDHSKRTGHVVVFTVEGRKPVEVVYAK